MGSARRAAAAAVLRRAHADPELGRSELRAAGHIGGLRLGGGGEQVSSG